MLDLKRLAIQMKMIKNEDKQIKTKRGESTFVFDKHKYHIKRITNEIKYCYCVTCHASLIIRPNGTKEPKPHKHDCPECSAEVLSKDEKQQKEVIIDTEKFLDAFNGEANASILEIRQLLRYVKNAKLM